MTQPNMQTNLNFVESQVAHIEEQVYRVEYPDIQYASLIPVDTSAGEWAKTVTYYSMDGVGRAQWASGKGFDIPLVSTAMKQHETGVFMSAIGYDYGLEEIEQATRLGIDLDGNKAMFARRAYEEFVDEVALEGDADKGWDGFWNHGDVTAVAAPNGASASPLWAQKAPEEVMADINNAITGVFTSTNTVGLADTVILPWERLSPLTTRTLANTDTTVLDFVRRNNLFTLQTGQELTIRGVRGLADKGAGGTARMIAYRNSLEVLKLHIPLALMFLPVQVQGLRYVIPGIFRLGGLDIRLPGEVRYVDGI